MESLNNIFKNSVPNYTIPYSKQEALGRAGALLAVTVMSKFIGDEETGYPVLDDYLFPAVKGTLVGLTVVSTVLAADFFINHAHDHGA